MGKSSYSSGNDQNSNVSKALDSGLSSALSILPADPNIVSLYADSGAPLHKLPVEVLVEIFSLLCYSCGDTYDHRPYSDLLPQHQNLMRIVSVCDTWRKIAIETPIFWSTIVVVPNSRFSLNLTRLFLDRCGVETQLHICFNLNHYSKFSSRPSDNFFDLSSDLLKMLLPYAHRFRGITLPPVSRDTLSQPNGDFLRKTLAKSSQMEYIIFDLESHSNSLTPDKPTTSDILSVFLALPPNIKFFSWTHDNFSKLFTAQDLFRGMTSESLFWSRLTHIRIYDMVDAENFIALLRACVHAEDIIVDRIATFDDDAPNRGGTKLLLPHLQKFKFNQGCLGDISLLFDCITCPNLQGIAVRQGYMLPEESMAQTTQRIGNFFTRCLSTSLREVWIADLPCAQVLDILRMKCLSSVPVVALQTDPMTHLKEAMGHPSPGLKFLQENYCLNDQWNRSCTHRRGLLPWFGWETIPPLIYGSYPSQVPHTDSKRIFNNLHT